MTKEQSKTQITSKQKAAELAMAQIQDRFGEGSIMRLGIGVKASSAAFCLLVICVLLCSFVINKQLLIK